MLRHLLILPVFLLSSSSLSSVLFLQIKPIVVANIMGVSQCAELRIELWELLLVEIYKYKCR